MTDLFNLVRLPTFTYCTDGKYYEDLVYQDFPERREWFVCFDPKEPAEIVIREAALKQGLTAYDILHHRGFDECLGLLVTRQGIYNGRKDVHKRFFGADPTDGKPLEGHAAVSWFLRFRIGVPLPAPNQYDSCVETWPVYPTREGVFFGVKPQ